MSKMKRRSFISALGLGALAINLPQKKESTPIDTRKPKTFHVIVDKYGHPHFKLDYHK